MFILSIFAAAGMFGLAASAGLLFRGSEAKKFHREITSREAATSYGVAVVIAAAVLLVNLFTSRTAGSPFWSWFLLLLALAVSFYLVCWWRRDGSSFKELLPFLAMVLLMFFTTSAAAEAVAANLSGIGAGIVLTIPTIVVVASVGYFVSNLLRFRARYSEHPVAMNRAGKIVAIVAVFLCLAVVFKATAAARRAETPDAAVAETVETEVVEQPEFPVFYNTLLQSDETAENDFDFGPSLPELLRLGGVNVNEGDLTAEDYDKDFRERLAKDPALGAAAMAWTDAIIGTRFLGTFYESAKEDWAKTINDAVLAWSEDQDAYIEKIQTFCALLDTAECSLEEGQGVLQDQMYMNPYTSDKRPDVIVMMTNDEAGTFLAYNFTIKGNTFVVKFRTSCGYQPTNVSRVMNITPATKPSSPSKTEEMKPSTPETTPSTPSETTPSTPDPEPTPAPTPTGDDPKDKSEGTQGELVQPNDDPGAGTSTNNGVGAQTSSEEGENSSVKESYEDYQNHNNDLDSTNKTQAEGGDSNEPSYTPTPSSSSGGGKVTVDNNGATGTGNGSADTATPVTDPAKTSDGTTIENDSDVNAGEAWGGPPD